MALNLSHHAESKNGFPFFFEAFGGLALRSFSEEGKRNAGKSG